MPRSERYKGAAMNVIMSCGGTGGHIYPAIAIADKIKEHHPDANILFIGTKKGMENSLVPAAGYEIRGIDASGIDRHHLVSNIKTLRDAMKGSQEAYHIMKDFKPDVAIGTGGYVTGSVIMTASRLGVPCYIHEQNAVVGVSNKMLERYATKVFISFESSKDQFRHPEKTVLSGNPIRSAFKVLDKAQCRQELGYSEEDRILLIFGGSLGAEIINKAALSFSCETAADGIKLIFITGRRYFDEIKAEYDARGGVPENTRLLPYADNMPTLMCASDLVVSRAGAIAVSELLACGKPSVLIPSPNVTNNHQFHNAKAVADSGAALLLQESSMKDDPELFSGSVISLLESPERLNAMSEAAVKIARLDAADIIYQNLNI
jgi:UDP-N-acetylglucosamine--N-acetylmuramyl-(pentapeptide) pyrophosphoryl-undecaprenol N-acetylglucosamine transferase